MPSSELRNSYGKVSELCKRSSEPIYLTVNGRDDTVIMSVESYEEMSKMALMYKIETGIRELESGKGLSKEEAASVLRECLGL